MTLLFLEPLTLFYYIMWVCDLCDCCIMPCDMWHMTCNVTFCLLCLYPNKEKEKEKKNKRKEKKRKIE